MPRFPSPTTALAASLLVGLLIAPPLPAQTEYYAAPPADKGSALIDRNRNALSDARFGRMMKDLLVKTDGTANARDAKFVFQECYGGGMLAGVEAGLGSVVRWVGGSAARYDQKSWGDPSTYDVGQTETINNKYPPASDYTRALAIELNNDPAVSLLSSLNAARDSDLLGINGQNKEEGQSIVRNGGATISLKDPGATSHHAILWAGQADRVRHFNNLNYIRTALMNAWAGTSYTITTLFGDGQHIANIGALLPPAWDAKPATVANLQTALDALKPQMNPNEQFFFYATGHGSPIAYATPPPVPVAPATSTTTSVTVDAYQSQLWIDDPTQTPHLNLEFELSSGMSGDLAEVFLNGNSLGRISALSGGFASLPIPDLSWILTGVNQLQIDNIGAEALDVSEIFLDSGDIPDSSHLLGVATPEPGTLALALAGAAIGIVRRRR